VILLEEEEMGETRSICEELRNAYKILVRKTESKKAV
jgi:hypothetical protein